MKEDLPILNLEGTYFYFDVKKQELRQTDNPSNKISFTKMDRDVDDAVLYYDVKTKNVFENWEGTQGRWPGHVRFVVMADDALEGLVKPEIYTCVLCPKNWQPHKSYKKFNKQQRQYLKNMRLRMTKNGKIKGPRLRN